MSVQKYNSKTLVKNEPIPYTQINTYVIQNIDDMEAGFVWVYLQSKPAGWDVIKAHIKNHFKMGNGKIKRIFSYLAKHNLIKNHAIRTPDGKKISHHDIEVLNGQDFNKPKELSTEMSTGSEINPVDNQPASFQPTINKRININKRKERGTERKKRVPLPEGFCFDEKVLQLLYATAIRVGLTADELVTKFEAFCKEKGKFSEDWNASFERFLIDERPRCIKNNSFSNKIEAHCAVPDFKPSNSYQDMCKPETATRHLNEIMNKLGRKSHGSDKKQEKGSRLRTMG